VARGAEQLQREMRITRLSAGVDASGTLQRSAMERTFDALRSYRVIMDHFGVQRGLLVATSAVRDASNGSEFLEQAKSIVGVETRLLAGKDEAELSYLGATTGLEPDERATLIVDIGGGSTELAFQKNGALESYSMQLGCVRVTERALGSGVVDAAHDLATREMIAQELNRAFESVPAFNDVVGEVRLVGLAGTVATLAQMDAGISVYDRSKVHHRVLPRSVVATWRDTLARETPQQRLTHPGMVEGREDVLTAGLYILEAVMDRFGVDACLSSENDILDGIALALSS
jgi:exopolyphosphatase/guanosine-5'-triphosphate,3'-diphosphate pyrophosphatase